MEERGAEDTRMTPPEGKKPVMITLIKNTQSQRHFRLYQKSLKQILL